MGLSRQRINQDLTLFRLVTLSIVIFLALVLFQCSFFMYFFNTVQCFFY